MIDFLATLGLVTLGVIIVIAAMFAIGAIEVKVEKVDTD
jgi:hypothetical protein